MRRFAKKSSGLLARKFPLARRLSLKKKLVDGLAEERKKKRPPKKRKSEVIGERRRDVRVIKRKIQFFKLTLAIRHFCLKLMRDMVLEAFSDMLFDKVIDSLGDILFN